MNKKFQNKYRIESTRLKGWNYSEDGAYFVTICTKNHEHFFGEIKNGKLELSPIGKIVAEEWQCTDKIRENVELDQWVVMPNHFHAIVIINNPNKTPANKHFNTPPVNTHCNAYPHKYQNKFGPQSNNLSAIVRGFKGATTKRVRKINPSFSWQSLFHDHIIRDEREINEIREYIWQNPENWETDRNNKPAS